MRSMKQLEERYGSLHAVNEQIQELLGDNGDNVAPVAKPYTAILPLVAAGLLHEAISEDALGDALTPDRWVELRSVLVDAINESFPDSGKAEEADAPTEASPGRTSTTSSPSDSVAAMTSSGTA